MRDRITQKDLEYLVKEINEITGQKVESYSIGEDGQYHANIGNYHLSYAYGGVNLHQMVTDGGGVTNPLGGGYHTKRELYYKLCSFIIGLRTHKKDSDDENL